MKPTDAKHTPNDREMELQRRCDVLKDALDGEVNEGVRMRRELCKIVEQRDALRTEVAKLRVALTTIADAGERGDLSTATMHAIKVTARDALKETV